MKHANLARTKTLLSLSVVSLYHFKGGGFFLLFCFLLIFAQVLELFCFPFYHTCSLQYFPSIIATMWNKDDPSKGSGLSRIEENLSSPS